LQDEQVLTLLRSQVGLIILGTVFLFVGIVACCIAAIRGRGGVRILVWFGIFNIMYGAITLAQVPAVFSLLPQSTWAIRPYVIPIINYLIFIPALLFWMELSRGRIRRFVQIATIATAIVGIAGVYSTIFTQSPSRLMPYSNLMSILVICVLLAYAFVLAVPPLARRFGGRHHRVSSIGTLVLAAATLYAYCSSVFHLPEYPFLQPIAFAVFVFSMGYTAADKIFTDSRRLLSIEKELAIARDIQNSILPSSVPVIDALHVHAAYFPMTAVAGDFYEFIPVDRNRVGVLVADVSGHGVPAALIAAMIKVAMQSIAACARDPREVLRGLNRILYGQTRGQLISAAYLWLDTETGKALYSAAGHPPLLCWRAGKLERIESNGLLIGVLPNSDFPVYEIPLNSGDRFLLYTDGVVEPENAGGDAFGDHKLEEVIRENQSRSPSELSDQLLSEIRRWQPASVTQQDDITLVIIDVA
jgi:sigma-B regulation protein RsbU (phosphoserine phosphatase)